MRGFLIGLLLTAGLVVTVLGLRPGGLSTQLRLAARRFRIVLVLGGVYIVASAVMRLAFADSLVSDYGPPAVAIVLAAIFLFVGRDPKPAPGLPPASRSR